MENTIFFSNHTYPMTVLHRLVSFHYQRNVKWKKIDFPLFSEKLYLSLYDIKNDQDTPYISSMKRIAQYPELFEAVGDNNRVLINNIIHKEKIKRR